jgi:hypothetical protein
LQTGFARLRPPPGSRREPPWAPGATMPRLFRCVSAEANGLQGLFCRDDGPWPANAERSLRRRILGSRLLGWTCRGQQAVEDLKMAGRLSLWQHHKVRSSAGSQQCVQVGNSRPRVEPVDAQRVERAIGWVPRQVIESRSSSLSLVLGRDSILEIQDYNVGARRGGRCEAVGAGCRRE